MSKKGEHNNNPIAVFDSGLGGLTVMREIAEALPHETIVYFGDTARLPYGSKSERTVRRYAVENTNFLLRFEPKLLIAACNTVSSVAMEHLRATFRLPMLGVVEPGSRAAARATKSGIIGVIATEATIKSGAYTRAITAIDSKIHVIARHTPLIVPMVEEGRALDDPAVALVLEQYLAPMLAEGVDALVLGCTHYPIFKAAVQRVVGENVAVVDSALSTAAEVSEMMDEIGRANPAAEVWPKYRFYVSDSGQRFMEIGGQFWGRELGNVVEITPEEFFFQK